MRVLLVDHDSEALETITRAIRGVLELDCVTSKGDALLLLRQNTYDVLIACERAIDGSGLDLLGRTTRTAVPLKRIFAAAPERLQLLGPRLAPFKVQRTINYPIDLEELWLAIAQVTSGPDDETDGTIERVVLDERGIPAAGTVPRAPIPPRPPAPLAPTPPPAVMPSTGSSGRYATARLPQPTPEPPIRVPAPARAAPQPAPAAARPATVPQRRPVPAPVAPLPVVEPFPAWTPEAPSEDEFAEIAAQAKFGVQQKVVDEAARRKRQRMFAAGGIAVVVASALVLLFEKFYDPAQRERDKAIAAEVQRMAEQQKVTDSLTLIEVDIENAIMNNDLDTARREFAELIEKSPNHPRRDFLAKSIERAAELSRLTPSESAPAQAAVMSPDKPSRPRNNDRAPERSGGGADRPASRTPDRLVAQTERSPQTRSTASTPPPRSFGAPVNDTPREAVIPLNAPINAPPTYTARRADNSFAGRTLEAGDSATGRNAAASAATNPAIQSTVPQSSVQMGAVSAPPTASGTAAGPMPNSAPQAAPQPPAAVNVVPAKIIKRVMPMAPAGVSRKTTGYVVLTYNIQTNGRVSDIQVIESQPEGVFDDSARDAVKRWVYEPRKENGVDVASPGKVRLVFDNNAN